ncbi:MAG: type II toxin-antitoxin system VapC family toxin [Nanoarchaeota archaeon]|nr:type II toxin-antitoxin system VapC family toxin [Nanoarchaeota archaeon]MBU4116435.1 type II toxin-antitoxin system VapC family toxin [Nanoarchaeota archaeon]
MIGLDTTAIIDIFKNDLKIIKLINSLDKTFASTIINHQEIMFGLDNENLQHLEEEKYYDDFFNNIFVFSLEKPSSKKASKIFWELKKQGESSGRFDCMIAGILLSNGINTIITRNVKHFKKIKNLKVISY